MMAPAHHPPIPAGQTTDRASAAACDAARRRRSAYSTNHTSSSSSHRHPLTTATATAQHLSPPSSLSPPPAAPSLSRGFLPLIIHLKQRVSRKTIHCTMNLDRAFVLLFASIGAVAGFTPNGPSAYSVASTCASRMAYVPTVRVASTVFSETEQAAEASETVEASSEAPAFETAIYVGNISFGKVHIPVSSISWVLLYFSNQIDHAH
jgi:hypothetical protein